MNYQTSKFVNQKNKKVKRASITMTILPLAACGGGGGGGGGGGAPVVPVPDPDFIESPTNVFIARDNNDRTLNESGNNQSVTVSGLGGDDTITTGGGADLIRGGEGIDIINAGAGNDAIVVVGTTTAGQYTNTDITNPAGSGTDLSALIELANLNGRTVSEVEAGETIDGGTGTNTLFIYGTVDLTGVIFNNITVLVVNSDVTLTPEQIAAFTTIDGDGNSVINIEIPEGSTDNYILDLSVIDSSDLGTINISGDITVVINDEEDIAGINNITVAGGSTLALEISDSGGETTVDLGNLASTFGQIDEIIVDEDATLKIDDPSDLTNVGLGEISGSGNVETGGDANVETALDGITVDPAINTTPVAVDDVDAAGENEIITTDVLANDSDPDGDTISIGSVSVPAGQGSVSIVSGEVRFDPGTDFDDLDDGDSEDVTVTYSVSDGQTTDEGKLVITVTGSNDAPDANDDTGGVSENETASFDVLDNDIDPDDDLTITAASAPGGQGSATIKDGKIEFNPGTDFDDLKAGETEDVLISYTASDGDVSDDATLTVTVTGVNDAPVAVDDTDVAGENEIITTDVLADDTDAENDVLTVSAASIDSGGGSVSIVGNQIRFDPGTAFDHLDDGDSAEVVVSYTVSDGDKSDDGTLTITVNGSNDLPVASDDTGNTDENVTASFDVLGNDTDPDDDLTITVATAPGGQGSASIVDGKIEFNPGADFDDLATGATEDVLIAYTISDGTVTDDGVLTVTVTGVNDAPVANDDTANADENETILIDATADDDDEENDPLTITQVSVGANQGSVSIVDNKIEFDPGTDFDGLATGATQDVVISYTISDGDKTDIGSATVTVTGVNDAPDTTEDEDSVLADATVSVDVMANDSDEEGATLTLTNVVGPVGKGSASIVSGEIFFDPGTDFDGLAPAETEEVLITYTVSDGNSTSDETLTITVIGPNEAPVTLPDAAPAGENETILVDVLFNDTDGDGHTLSLSDVSVGADQGSVSIVDGKVQFDPGNDFDYLLDGQNVDVDITYTATDGIDETDGTLTVTVNGTTEEPVALDDVADVREESSVLIDVLDNDSDPEGGDLTINGASTDLGTVTIENGELRFTANNDFNDLGYGETRDATITYTAQSDFGTAEATVTVTVGGRNDDPTATNDVAAVIEGGTVQVDILGNDTDVDGDSLFIYSLDSSSFGIFYVENGELYFDTAGDFNYLDAGQTANVVLFYDVIDGRGGTDTGQLTVTVHGVDDSYNPINTNFFLYATDIYFPENPVAGTFSDVYLNRDTLIFGWEYGDDITMGSGDDYIDGYDGGDDMDGGPGIDMLGYFYSDAGVTVNLSTGYASGGFASGDDFINIEAIDGSEYRDTLTGDDNGNTLYGNSGNDTINGLGGNDYIDGGSGSDTLDGGDGIDTLMYTYSTSGVTVNLATGSTSGGDASGDTITGFEDVYGSDYNDVITGDDNANLIDGYAGTDILNGAGGDDIFLAWEFESSEQDQFNGGTGYDGIVFYGESSSTPYNIDLSALNATNIEIIDLHQSSDYERLIFSAQDIIDITDADNTLRIFGGANDDFQTTYDWTYVSDFTFGDVLYSTYTSGDATIEVSRTIAEDNMFLPLPGTFYESEPNVWQDAGGPGATLELASSPLPLTVYSLDGNDDITTGNSNDKIYSSEGSKIDAGDGIDTLYLVGRYNDVDLSTNTFGNAEKVYNIENIVGSEFDDNITGDDLVNVIIGGAGSDIIEGMGGADILDGGEGGNTISYDRSFEALTIDLRDNSVSGGDADGDIISNFQNIIGTSFDDHITGNDESNHISGRDGENIIYGNGGNDYLGGGADNDTIYGGDGTDYIHSYDGNDMVYGGEGNDDIETGDGDDYVYGEAGDDHLEAGWGNDYVYGGEGNDHIEGSLGDDYLSGGDGDDYIIGSSGADTMIGGAGNDAVSFYHEYGYINYNLETNTLTGDGAIGDSVSGFENVVGTRYDDILTGDANDNALYGSSGDDIIYGGAGVDILTGAQGDDTLIFSDILDTYDGGAGVDTLTSNVELNLDLSDLNMSWMDIVDLDNTFSDTITFSLQDVIDSTSYRDNLRIDGTALDTATSTGEGWIQGADQNIDGEDYHTYTAGDATLLIDTDIIQDIT